jgi:phage I-like protein
MIDNLESMSADELRSMLVAKDEMVRELEDKIKEMKADSEAKLTEEKPEDEAEKMAESKDEDEPKKMAESKEEDEPKKMAESKDDEKKSYAMNEGNALLLSEITALRETVNALKAEKEAVEMREAVSTLLREGRISPAEQEVANQAWQLRESNPAFWQMFNERPANSSVPLNQVGHGASGEEITKATLHAEVSKLQSEKSISYSEALNLFRTQNPDYYKQAFGV